MTYVQDTIFLFYIQMDLLLQWALNHSSDTVL